MQTSKFIAFLPLSPSRTKAPSYLCSSKPKPKTQTKKACQSLSRLFHLHRQATSPACQASKASRLTASPAPATGCAHWGKSPLHGVQQRPGRQGQMGWRSTPTGPQRRHIQSSDESTWQFLGSRMAGIATGRGQTRCTN